MNRLPLLITALGLVGVSSGCAAAKATMPSMAAMSFDSAAPAAPLENDYFARDKSAVGEGELKEILAAPVFLEEHARIGIVPVAAKYEPDDAVPVEGAPATIVESLEASGLFDLASEVSTEWPAERGLPGLRELAARYRTEYLILFRHRFNDVMSPNGWAVGWATIVGVLFLPANTIDTAGVLEATMYDVKSGTILFTVNERVRGSDVAALTAVDTHVAALHRKLVAVAAPKLADQVVAQCRRLVASRPAPSKAQAITVAQPD